MASARAPASDRAPSRTRIHRSADSRWAMANGLLSSAASLATADAEPERLPGAHATAGLLQFRQRRTVARRQHSPPDGVRGLTKFWARHDPVRSWDSGELF